MQDVIDEIMFKNRKRQQWVRARTGLTNQIKAIKRGLAGGKNKELTPDMEGPFLAIVEPLEAARDMLKKPISDVEKQLAALGNSLPVAEWWCGHRGQNVLGLAQIVGSAGDLSLFRNPSCLWKWFGLHVSDGAAPKGARGKKMDHAPWRRAVVKVIGTSIKMQGGEDSPYRKLYDERKAYETAKNEAGDYAERARKMLAADKDWSDNQKACMAKGQLTPMHIDARAMRYMEKRLLRDLWCQWRDAMQVKAPEHEEMALMQPRPVPAAEQPQPESLAA